MPYEACLFDMDGVIINTSRAVTEFWLEVAHQHGVTLTPEDFNQRIYGCPGVQTLRVLFSHLSADEHEAILTRMGEYEETQEYVAVEGALTFVGALRERGIPTALVTSGDRPKLSAVAAQLRLVGLFATTITVEDVLRGKPAPDGYRLAAQRLGVAPERCVVFEDSLSGVQAALAAGATVIGVRPPESALALLDLGAQRNITSFAPEHVRLVAAGEGGAGALSLCDEIEIVFRD